MESTVHLVLNRHYVSMSQRCLSLVWIWISNFIHYFDVYVFSQRILHEDHQDKMHRWLFLSMASMVPRAPSHNINSISSSAVLLCSIVHIV